MERVASADLLLFLFDLVKLLLIECNVSAKIHSSKHNDHWNGTWDAMIISQQQRTTFTIKLTNLKICNVFKWLIAIHLDSRWISCFYEWSIANGPKIHSSEVSCDNHFGLDKNSQRIIAQIAYDTNKRHVTK